MRNTAIAFSTKDRVELSKQSHPVLVAPDFKLFWADGSQTVAGQNFFARLDDTAFASYEDVQGGADAAIVHNLTKMLQYKEFDYVGIVENDVLLDKDWFEPTMALFERGRKDGLCVGAVSARCYEDRILFQRDGYAVMHNIGAGMIIFSRPAAELVLGSCRTGHTLENRRTFMQVSGLDPASWNGFLRDPHATCMDWQFERILAQRGYAALALTPSKCQMIGQDPPLEQQGLKLVTEPVDALRHDDAFDLFVSRMQALNEGRAVSYSTPFFSQDDGSEIVMPHQLGWLWGGYSGKWKLKWVQAHGPFVYVADEENAELDFIVSGPISVLVSGGAAGGSIKIKDEMSGFDFSIRLDPEQGQVLSLNVPASVSTRKITVTALQPGVTFYGVNMRGPQLIDDTFRFNHAQLPPP